MITHFFKAIEEQSLFWEGSGFNIYKKKEDARSYSPSEKGPLQKYTLGVEELLSVCEGQYEILLSTLNI